MGDIQIRDTTYRLIKGRWHYVGREITGEEAAFTEVKDPIALAYLEGDILPALYRDWDELQDLYEECLEYVPPYFVNKWGLDRLKGARYTSGLHLLRQVLDKGGR